MFETIPTDWPLWLVIAAVLVKMFQKELAAFLPSAVRDYFGHRARLRSDQQAHSQEIEEVSVEALAQSSVTAQMQLINVNRSLIEFLTMEIDGRLSDIEKTLSEVKDLSLRGQASDRIVQMEWSRIVDTLTRTERTLSSIDAWIKGTGQPDATPPA